MNLLPISLTKKLIAGLLLASTGWAFGWVSKPSSPAAARPTATRAISPAFGTDDDSSASCTDRAAMEANANLVRELTASRGRLETMSAELRAVREANGGGRGPANGSIGADEWARMTQDGTLRIKQPCASWNSSHQLRIRRQRRGSQMGFGSRSAETRERARLADLSDADLESLDAIYTRTHSRTWSRMRSACEANVAYKAALAELLDDQKETYETSLREVREQGRPAGELEAPAPMTDEARVSLCSRVVIEKADARSLQATFASVARLRASGKGPGASDVDQIVLLALSSSSEALVDEMTKTLGKDKAQRILDNGVSCFNETVFDTREPDPPAVRRAHAGSDLTPIGALESDEG